MVTVAVTVILLAVAVPNYINFMRANKLSTNVNSFVQALQFARLEARGRGATLCASADQQTCNSTDWRDGWIIFSDFNVDGVPNGNDEILRVVEALPAGITIKVTASGLAAPALLKFGGQGFEFPAGATHTFEFCIGRDGKGAGRKVTVNLAGSSKTEPLDTCSAT